MRTVEEIEALIERKQAEVGRVEQAIRALLDGERPQAQMSMLVDIRARLIASCAALRWVLDPQIPDPPHLPI